MRRVGGMGKNFEISDSEENILVHPGDGFDVDNGESRKILWSDRGVWTIPLDPPLTEVTTVVGVGSHVRYGSHYSQF